MEAVTVLLTLVAAAVVAAARRRRPAGATPGGSAWREHDRLRHELAHDASELTRVVTVTRSTR